MRVLVKAATEECDPRLLAYCINVCPSRDKKASKTRLLEMRDVLGFIGSTGNVIFQGRIRATGDRISQNKSSPSSHCSPNYRHSRP